MDGIGTDRVCPRCSSQVVLRVETPGRDTFTDELTELLDVAPSDRVIIKTQCDCSTPRFVGLSGSHVYEDEINE